MREAFTDWGRSTMRFVVRLGPIMILAGFASGLVMQWTSPDVVEKYLGNNVMGVAIAATFGLLINVPLLFEIPLVALLLLLGMGTAPAATLLFAAAAGGPITFWGLAKSMPKRAVVTFAAATWTVGIIGGVAILGYSLALPSNGSGLRIEAVSHGESLTAPRITRTESPMRFTDITIQSGIDYNHVPLSEKFDNVDNGWMAGLKTSTETAGLISSCLPATLLPLCFTLTRRTVHSRMRRPIEAPLYQRKAAWPRLRLITTTTVI